MTNEEAIKRLKKLKAIYSGMDIKSDIDALDMAISALTEKNNCVRIIENIKSEIKEWYWQADKQALAKDPCVVDAMVDLFIRTIDKYKESEEEE